MPNSFPLPKNPSCRSLSVVHIPTFPSQIFPILHILVFSSSVSLLLYQSATFFCAGHSFLYPFFLACISHLTSDDKPFTQLVSIEFRTNIIMRTEYLISAAAFLVASVSAHGNITSPQARLPGPAMLAACGSTAVAAVESDGTIPLEDVTSPASTCSLYPNN
jgi:hypothetical protein